MKNKSNIPFLGRGWSFPPEFNNVKGTVRLSQDEQDIRESLEILLSTIMGERVMAPRYGCDLSILFFESLSSAREKYLSDKISTAILRFEPRIKTDKIEMTFHREEGRIDIEINYTIRTTNTRSNMVYPFYLNEGTNL